MNAYFHFLFGIVFFRKHRVVKKFQLDRERIKIITPDIVEGRIKNHYQLLKEKVFP